jgi:hypothetical protein
VNGLKHGLGEKATSMIVAETPYETVDSQVVNLKASGVDIFFNVTIPKFAVQAIRKLGLAGSVQILKQCGDNLTRENIMQEAANLKDFQPPMFLPGDQCQYEPYGLLSGQADADGPFERRTPGAVPPSHHGRNSRLTVAPWEPPLCTRQVDDDLGLGRAAPIGIGGRRMLLPVARWAAVVYHSARR